MAAWRFRRCPFCGVRRPAGEFLSLDFGANWQTKGRARRRCPACGYIGVTADFRVQEQPRPRKAAPVKRPAEKAATRLNGEKTAPEPVAVPWWAR